MASTSTATGQPPTNLKGLYEVLGQEDVYLHSDHRTRTIATGRQDTFRHVAYWIIKKESIVTSRLCCEMRPSRE
jgi:hypothetical protein